MKPWEENKKMNYIKNAKKDFRILLTIARESNNLSGNAYLSFLTRCNKTLDKIERHYLYDDAVKETEILFSTYAKKLFSNNQ